MTGITFRTEDGIALEGEVRDADGSARGTAVVCHPHPQYGGSKDHPLLWAIRNELAGRWGLTVLSFNFRGVMGSEGSYTGGQGERLDVAAAVDRVRREAGGPTALVGWSFGADMALRHALGDPRVEALAMVGIPLGSAASARRPLPTLERLEGLRIPVLLLAGGDDPICPSSDLENLARWISAAETAILPGTDHFFGGREREAAEAVGGFIAGALHGASGR